MKTIALCCRGGGTKSVSSVGVLKALIDMGFTISRISGTSIGSTVCLYATGASPDDILKLLKENVIIYSKTSRVMGGNGNFAVLERTVDEVAKGKTFSQCNIPIHICTSTGGFLTPKPLIFSKENFPNLTLGKACRASSSFPFLYQTFRLVYEGQTYNCLDGGLTHNPAVIKSENEVSLLSTFYPKENLKQNTHSLYAKAWQIPEKTADIVIKPIVPLGTLGTPEECQMAFDLGYKETIKHYNDILALAI